MNYESRVDEIERLIKKISITDKDQNVLCALCDGKQSAISLARLCSMSHFVVANGAVGTLAKRIYNATDEGSFIRKWREYDPDHWYGVLATGTRETEDGYFNWVLRPEIRDAIEHLGWCSNFANGLEVDREILSAFEGDQIKGTIRRRERVRRLREECLRIHGFKCSVCGMSFEEEYGEIGKSYIHIHHLNPLGERQHSSSTNPVTELVPICPNCHAMLHIGGTIRTIEEVRRLYLAH